MNPIWQIELLGGLHGQSENGAEFAPGVSRAGAIFAYLALFPETSHAREVLAALFWPEADTASARTRLRQELSVLRRQLEPEGVPDGSVLTRERNSVALVPGAVVTDIARFRAALVAARKAKNEEERERLLEEAVALYRGELLPGYDFDGLEAERAHLAQSYETALRELAAVRQARGDYDGAETCLRRLVIQNPYLEEAHADLMRLHAATGQPTRVREQYRELERTLRKEFDAEPTGATRQLMERLCREAAVVGNTASPPITALAAPLISAAASNGSHPDGTTPSQREDRPDSVLNGRETVQERNAETNKKESRRSFPRWYAAGMMLLFAGLCVFGLSLTVLHLPAQKRSGSTAPRTVSVVPQPLLAPKAAARAAAKRAPVGSKSSYRRHPPQTLASGISPGARLASKSASVPAKVASAPPQPVPPAPQPVSTASRPVSPAPQPPVSAAQNPPAPPVQASAGRLPVSQEGGVSFPAPTLQPLSLGRLQPGHTAWVYAYQPRPGEEPNSEPKSITLSGPNVFVTGLIRTEKEDVDILTLKISSEGKLLWADRYSNPEHECDRAFSITNDTHGGVFVAGESYVPARPGVPEGWRLVALHYDANGKRLWVRRSPVVTKNADEGVQVVGSDKGGCWVGGTALVRGAPHLLVLRYDEAGRLLWARTAARESTFSRMTTKSEEVYVCGAARRRDARGLHSSWLVARFERDGKPTWERAAVGPGPEGSPGQIVLQQTALYVGGVFQTGNPDKAGGIDPGIVKLNRESGERLWTTGQEVADPGYAFGEIVEDEQGVWLAGECVPLSGPRHIAIARYDGEGGLLWARRVDVPTGYGNLHLAAMHGGVFGALLTPGHSTDFGYGDLLIMGVNGDGTLSYAFAVRPTGTGAHGLRALIPTDDGLVYLAAQSFFPERPTLTVTKLLLR